MTPIGEILPLTRVVLDLEVSSKKRLFETLGTLMADSLSVEQSEATEDLLLATDVFECLFARERLGATGLGYGVAIPHGRHRHVKKTMGAFIRLKEAVEFDAPDDKPVSLVFVLLVPEEANQEHLAILGYLAEKFADKNIRQSLLTCEDTQTARDLLVSD